MTVVVPPHPLVVKGLPVLLFWISRFSNVEFERLEPNYGEGYKHHDGNEFVFGKKRR